ncbi:MAG TPA: copper-translocating P-type ATPase [Acholeplasma sp.]|nr:copper-translocating P-type ATPase [Acholeplasma sp.]
MYTFRKLHHNHDHGSLGEKKVCSCPGCKGEGTDSCTCGCLTGESTCKHDHHEHEEKVCTCPGCEDAGSTTCECGCLNETQMHNHDHKHDEKECCGSCKHDEHEEQHEDKKVCSCPGCKGEGTDSCTCGCLTNESACKHEGHDHAHHHHHDHSHHNHNHHDHSHHGHHGHHSHHGHGGHDHSAHIKDYLIRFIISTILSIPVLIFSQQFQEWFNYSISFPFDEYVVLVLATAIFIYGGIPFFSAAYYEIKAKEPAMMSLVALAITVSYVYSVMVTFGFAGMDFYWELVTLIDIMLLGHFLEMKSSMVASDALASLTNLLPSEAHVYVDGNTHDVPLKDLKVNQVVLVKPGEKIPVDGLILWGESSIDESMVTGESNPVFKTINETVIGGTINGDGVLRIKVTKLGEDSYLSQVVKLVNESLMSKSKTQRLADLAAKYLFYISITAALITWLAWGLVGADTDFIFTKIVAVIVIACPHALGVAIPLVTSISTSLAAKNGLLIKNRNAFENARKVKHVIFDKTGTLTDGKFTVTNVITIKRNLKGILEIAHLLEQTSTHPIAKGILEYTKNVKTTLQVVDTKNLPGYGVIGKIDGKNVAAVSQAYLNKEGIFYDKNVQADLDQQGLTIVYIVEENEVLGMLTLKDQVKPSAIYAIKELNSMGIVTHMLTGDNEAVAKRVASELGITTFRASMLPHQKSQYIDEIKIDGTFVAMTGDGINDAPALAKADLGIAIGAGTDVAIETADIILVKSEPKDVLKLIELSKKTYRKMIENLIWALAYNVFSLPLAAGALYSIGFEISPAIGAILMSLSTIIVSINAQFLKLKK